MQLHFRVNGLGALFGIQAVLDTIKRQGSGSIVNVSSLAGIRGTKGFTAYAASKWLIRGISKSAAVELAPFGIRVNTIVPGFVDTPMLAANAPETIKSWLSLVPNGRIGQPNDVAQAAAYLSSDVSSYVTGQELIVDGGFSA